MIVDITFKMYNARTGDYIDTKTREVKISDNFNLKKWSRSGLKDVYHSLFITHPDDFPSDDWGVNVQITNIERKNK